MDDFSLAIHPYHPLNIWAREVNKILTPGLLAAILRSENADKFISGISLSRLIHKDTDIPSPIDNMRKVGWEWKRFKQSIKVIPRLYSEPKYVLDNPDLELRYVRNWKPCQIQQIKNDLNSPIGDITIPFVAKFPELGANSDCSICQLLFREYMEKVDYLSQWKHTLFELSQMSPSKAKAIITNNKIYVDKIDMNCLDVLLMPGLRLIPMIDLEPFIALLEPYPAYSNHIKVLKKFIR